MFLLALHMMTSSTIFGSPHSAILRRQYLSSPFAFWYPQSAVMSSTKPAVLDGVYSNEQAERGESYYTKECAPCHLADLGGDGLRATPLIGDSFAKSWNNRTVGDLFKVIKATMPEDQPGALNDVTYIDIISYLLKMNNYPAGMQQLSTDPTVLYSIAFKR
jgi:hypothetical protein